MKCPLFIMNDTRAQLGEETEIGECIQEECAWWDKDGGRCGVLMIPKHLYTLEKMLGLILEKMPYEHAPKL